MSNQYTDIMKQRSDKELIVVTTVEKHKYEVAALEAAQKELSSRDIDAEEFAIQTQKVELEDRKNVQLDNSLASTSDRVVHAIVDRIVFIIGLLLLSFLLSFVDVIVGGLPPMILFLCLLLYFILVYSIPEFLFKKTLGKVLTASHVVKSNGEAMSFGDALSRSACRLIPFDWVSFLINPQGWHDTLSDTKVIKDNAVINK